MIDTKKIILTVMILILPCLAGKAAEPRVGENVVLRPQMTSLAPKIDGILDDPAWSGGPIVRGSFITNHPVYGTPLPEKTEVWLTYDPDNLYFAFYCHDDPGKIKGTLTKRDNIFSEDWIDVDIDAMGNRQFTLENACNPLGVQGDLINSASGGESADPDWVWYSAGRIVADGYIVEMKLPVKSIKFRKRGERDRAHGILPQPAAIPEPTHPGRRSTRRSRVFQFPGAGGV